MQLKIELSSGVIGDGAGSGRTSADLTLGALGGDNRPGNQIMKPRLYLETTIPSYLVARRSRDLRLAAQTFFCKLGEH